MMEGEVELLLHEYVPPPPAVIVADPPAQMVAEVAVAVGVGFTLTVMLVESWQVPLDAQSE